MNSDFATNRFDRESVVALVQGGSRRSGEVLNAAAECGTDRVLAKVSRCERSFNLPCSWMKLITCVFGFFSLASFYPARSIGKASQCADCGLWFLQEELVPFWKPWLPVSGEPTRGLWWDGPIAAGLRQHCCTSTFAEGLLLWGTCSSILSAGAHRTRIKQHGKDFHWHHGL